MPPDEQDIWNTLSRMAFDEDGHAPAQIASKLADMGRSFRSNEANEARRKTWIMGALMALIGALASGLFMAIINAHHWLGT
jgi:hypothetical protein